jgi:hypothetical protein
VYGSTTQWYSWTGRAEDQRRDKRRTLGVPPDSMVQPPTLPRLFLQHKARTPSTCGVLIRREVIEQLGGFDERFRGMFEDQVFFYKLLLYHPVFVEGGSWDRYRQHPTSHSRMMSRIGYYHPKRKGSPAYGVFLNWLEQYLIEHHIVDQQLWDALYEEKKLFRYPIIYKISLHVDRVKTYTKAIIRRLAQLV